MGKHFFFCSQPLEGEGCPTGINSPESVAWSVAECEGSQRHDPHIVHWLQNVPPTTAGLSWASDSLAE